MCRKEYKIFKRCNKNLYICVIGVLERENREIVVKVIF